MVSHVSSPMATWSCLILLLSLHLAMNHAAVRSVSMRNLNRQRANIVLSNLIEDNKVLAPQDVSQNERIFEWDGILRWKGSPGEGKAYMGVTMQQFMSTFTRTHSRTGAMRDVNLHLQKIVEMYRKEDFLFWCDRSQRIGYIVLKESATPEAQLKVWAVALLVLHRLKTHPHATSAIIETNEMIFDMMDTTLREMTDRWSDWMQRLEASGWDIQVASLETLSGTRICLGVDEEHNESSRSIQAKQS